MLADSPPSIDQLAPVTPVAAGCIGGEFERECAREVADPALARAVDRGSGIALDLGIG